MILHTVLAGFGIAHLPLNMTQPYIEARQLKPVLEDWWATFPGYHLYYPSRRQASPAFARLMEVLRYEMIK